MTVPAAQQSRTERCRPAAQQWRTPIAQFGPVAVLALNAGVGACVSAVRESRQGPTDTMGNRDHPFGLRARALARIWGQNPASEARLGANVEKIPRGWTRAG